MKKVKVYLVVIVAVLSFISCNKSEKSPLVNDVTLQFEHMFKNENIVLGTTASTASVHVSSSNQSHGFSEIKYVISNIRLVRADGVEVPYHIHDLDKGAAVINQAKSESLQYVLSDIPSGEYKQIKFGLGVPAALNILDQTKFPKFYAQAGANDTKMHWEWGSGFRFTKIEGFYGQEQAKLSIHTGSTVAGTVDDPASYVQGVDAYRDITLDFPLLAVVGMAAPKITIRADFDKLLSGKTNKITLSAANALPSTHTAVNMVLFVDNLGGNGQADKQGMFSIIKVDN